MHPLYFEYFKILDQTLLNYQIQNDKLNIQKFLNYQIGITSKYGNSYRDKIKNY